ncbi:hypothetical protein A1Q2_00662 [Trichosporon asahii var. asahii CBS 8904]|uniref:Uncharacterized protein n=1 Tax=Trichosporon asahii var. asahii (strain CBS 8904) TaxID=1220162 RepID=K1VLK7_TRIAC|nr:hypothetical protein A1Q2_00662 [Trichosporon asahii var. asahii CBS 8904]
MHAALATRRLGFTSRSSDEELQKRIWAYAESPGQFPIDDAPTTPFPHRRSIPHGPSVPFPDRRSVPFERQSLLDPASNHSSSGQYERESEQDEQSPEPASSPVFSLTAPNTTPPSHAAVPTAHTQVHLLDFASDASVDKLRRGRVLPLHLSPAARHILLIRTERTFDLFPECGVLLTLDPPEPSRPETELVIAIESVQDWEEADEALQAEFPALFHPDCAERYEAGGVYGGIVEEGVQGTDMRASPARATFAAGLTAQAKRRSVQLVTHEDDDVYLLPTPGPGFVNWLLAGLADALELHPGLHVSFANVQSWDSRWVRPHWAGAIVEDLLGMSAEEAAGGGPMRIHLHSGIKQAGRSQHAWDKEKMRRVREDRVGYLDEEGWERVKREMGAGRL